MGSQPPAVCEAWAVSSDEADLVLGGGTIRTPAHPSGFAAALAVRDGVIQAVGSDDEIRELTGRRTRVIDLKGRLALPAFGDAHVHPVGGGLESLRCNLVGLRSRHECLEVVAEYCASLAPGAWVTGGGWTMSAFPGGLPTAADLDTVTAGHPAFLPNRDHHTAWVNTAALTLAGIDASALLFVTLFLLTFASTLSFDAYRLSKTLNLVRVSTDTHISVYKIGRAHV